MTPRRDPHARIGRFITGVRGLDEITLGGLMKGGVYLIMGSPGNGKTILANQIAFHHVAGGGRAVFLTLLSESHERMFSHLEAFEFFDRTKIGNGLTYLSAYPQLEKDGVKGLIRYLQQQILKSRPSVLFIDGLAVAGEFADSTVAFKKFVHELNVFTSLTGCTAILLTSMADGLNRPEHTVVDGIIGMSMTNIGQRTFREFEVRKLRGTYHLPGRHYFRIGPSGIEIYPRLESMLWDESNERPPAKMISTGIIDLDRLMDGGVPEETVTTLLGAAGTGKTVLGMHFLAAGLALKQPSLYFSFYETPPRFLAKAKRLGFDFESERHHGLFTIQWHPPTEQFMDEIALALIDLVKKHNVKRLFLDGAEGLFRGETSSDRLHPFMTALANELRLLGVTTLMSEETKLFDPIARSPVSDLSAVTENIIFLRSIEKAARLERLLSVIKVRDGACDRTIQSFSITDAGIRINGPYSDVDRQTSKLGIPESTRGSLAKSHQAAKKRRIPS